MPGEQLAQNVLDANLLSVLQLVIVLFVLAIVLLVAAILAMMYYNSQAVSKMSQTQQNMSNANAQWALSDSKKTEALGRSTAALESSVDELKLLRQDWATHSSMQEQMAEKTNKAVEDHEVHSAERAKTIIDQVTAGNAALHKALTEAVTNVNEATLKPVTLAHEAIDKLAIMGDSFSTREEATREMLKKQHEDQMEFLKEQSETHTRIWREQLTQAQHAILDSLTTTEEKTPDEDFTPLPTPLMVTDHDPLATTLEPVGSDGSGTRPGG